MNLPELPSTLNLAVLTAGIAGIATFWNQIKGFFQRFSSALIVTAVVDGDAARALAYYLFTTFKPSIFSKTKFTGWESFVKPLDGYYLVGYELVGERMTFWKGRRPIFLNTKENNGLVHVSFLRGSFDLKSLLVEAVDHYNQYQKEGEKGRKRYRVQKLFGKFNKIQSDQSEKTIDSNGPSVETAIPLRWDRKDIGTKVQMEPFGSLHYDEKVKAFIERLRIWKNCKDYFKTRSLPWRFGAGLFGPPGTGKSSLVRAIAQEFDFPVDHYDLTSMSNEEFVSYWKESLNRAPCIVLLEDIDRIFHKDQLVGQQNTLTKGRLTMDCILNCIQGVESSDGILTFITANDTTKLDEALGVPDESGKSSRPGRLDEAVFFKPLNKTQRIGIASRILDFFPEDISEVVNAGEGETGAQFEKRCADKAVKRFWELSEDSKALILKNRVETNDEKTENMYC